MCVCVCVCVSVTMFMGSYLLPRYLELSREICQECSWWYVDYSQMVFHLRSFQIFMQITYHQYGPLIFQAWRTRWSKHDRRLGFLQSGIYGAVHVLRQLSNIGWKVAVTPPIYSWQISCYRLSALFTERPVYQRFQLLRYCTVESGITVPYARDVITPVRSWLDPALDIG